MTIYFKILLICIELGITIMEVVSRANDLNFTNAISVTTLHMNYCFGNDVPPPVEYIKNHGTHNTNMLSKFRNPTKGFIANRNSDIKILKKVRTQLKIARKHFRNNREIIAWLYKDVKTVMGTDYHYDWLPSYPLNWYKNHVEKLDKDTKMFTLLPVLRDSLVNFSVTFDQMRQFGERKYMSNYTVIKRILDDLFNHLTAVLCEVETALRSASTWHHDWRVPHGAKAVIVGGAGWNANPDHTAMVIQDWGVLIVYYRFLKEWLLISRKMVQDQTDVRPDPISSPSSSSSSTRSPCTRHHKCRSTGRGHGPPLGIVT
ncbi:uncharacterized protein LOC112692397 isoform X2 [Sipha flava]|uniref:Uncharacterized protein LOC112692397 isoform X2 n=1 Tax=Sipha flava TaxID=143950 RepID=A0A8B8GIU4_9HEMI|nr:uncharacterized protein LOC112692397 isoform X2 [Sipha flava]